ncbi:MAG: DUF5695 domain-containing protein, partial [Gemmatimonadota bacterium]
ERAAVWESLGYPFGSEMPGDSTGQEEVYAWSRCFGLDEKAAVTLNAIPVLTEYRDHPDDFYLLRVGYGGLLGAIANVTRDGFGPAAFHSYPSTLRIDGITGDYAQNFLGHALNTGTYVVDHPEFGWLAFGGNLERSGPAGDETIRVLPRDAARSRVYLAHHGLWLTLEAGRFESVVLDGDRVRIALAPGDVQTPEARLRVEQPGAVAGAWNFTPASELQTERGAWRIPLDDEPTEVALVPGG